MTESTDRPRALRIATWLALGVAVIGALQAITAFAEQRNLDRAIPEAGKYMNIDQVLFRTTHLRGSLELALSLGLIALLAMPLLGLVLWQGRRWARIATWLVAGVLVIGEIILTSADSSAVKTGDFVTHFDVPGGNPDTVEMLNRMLVPMWFPPLHYAFEFLVLVGAAALAVQVARPVVADYFRREEETMTTTTDDRVWSTDAVRPSE